MANKFQNHLFQGNTNKFVRIFHSQLNFTGATQLTQYFVMDVAYTPRANVEDGVSVTIVLGRKILSQILTTFLPTVRICIRGNTRPLNSNCFVFRCASA